MQIGNTQATEAERLMQNLRMTVLESRRMPLGPEWHLDLCSPFWRFYVNTRSGAWMVHRGVRQAMAGGEFWLVPAWVRFQTGVTGPVRQDYIHFTVRGLPARFFQKIFDRPLRLPSTPPLNSLCRQWRKDWDAPADLGRLCWAAAVVQTAFATTLPDHLPSGPGQSESVQAVMDALTHRMNPPPGNAELARIFGGSEDHFIRQFRQETGWTPARYGRERRLATAAEWLAVTERTIEDIAEATGFTDRFHFSRVFKIRFDQTPAAYRRMHRQEFAALAGQTINMASP